ncbi:regulatory protein, TetR [Burkholderia cenocepacia PC184]|nr:regulatory protein, TetR [Burkholderia cenocepacia PC184]
MRRDDRRARLASVRAGGRPCAGDARRPCERRCADRCVRRAAARAVGPDVHRAEDDEPADVLRARAGRPGAGERERDPDDAYAQAAERRERGIDRPHHGATGRRSRHAVARAEPVRPDHGVPRRAAFGAAVARMGGVRRRARGAGDRHDCRPDARAARAMACAARCGCRRRGIGCEARAGCRGETTCGEAGGGTARREKHDAREEARRALSAAGHRPRAIAISPACAPLRRAMAAGLPSRRYSACRGAGRFPRCRPAAIRPHRRRHCAADWRSGFRVRGTSPRSVG